MRRGVLDRTQFQPADLCPTRRKLSLIIDHMSQHMCMCKHDLMPLAVCRTLEWTTKYGLNNQSMIALSTCSLIMSGVVGDFQGGSTLARKALEISETITSYTEVKTSFVAHAFTLMWTEPIRDQLKPLFQAYEVGFRCGDI